MAIAPNPLVPFRQDATIARESIDMSIARWFMIEAASGRGPEHTTRIDRQKRGIL